ncbi:MAG: hypothetical protein EHM21_10485 [Chloroflexi bacterium]|nr:MAG: hypothetical protein EHM21_10485 [Chloroflexota bacterium]
MTTPKSAWVQLYQARQVKADVSESRSPGRPPSPIPRRKVGLTLSQGEITELDHWQERLSGLLGRKISTGETVGILTRIATARLGRLNNPDSIDSLVELVEKLVGE